MTFLRGLFQTPIEKLKERGDTKRLIKALKNRPDLEEQRAAVRALGDLAAGQLRTDMQVVYALVAALNRPGLGAVAADALSRIRDTLGTGSLAEALRKKVSDLREMADRLAITEPLGVGRPGQAQLSPYIEEILVMAEALTRLDLDGASAAEVLFRAFGVGIREPRLVKMSLQIGSAGIRHLVLELGGQRVVEWIDALLGEDGGEYGRALYVDLLITVLQNSSREEGRAIAEALLKTEDPRVIAPVVWYALWTQQWDIITGLGSKTVPFLVEWLGGRSASGYRGSDELLTVVRILGKFGEPRATDSIIGTLRVVLVDAFEMAGLRWYWTESMDRAASWANPRLLTVIEALSDIGEPAVETLLAKLEQGTNPYAAERDKAVASSFNSYEYYWNQGASRFDLERSFDKLVGKIVLQTLGKALSRVGGARAGAGLAGMMVESPSSELRLAIQAGLAEMYSIATKGSGCVDSARVEVAKEGIQAAIPLLVDALKGEDKSGWVKETLRLIDWRPKSEAER